jgi:hypothetical protein
MIIGNLKYTASYSGIGEMLTAEFMKLEMRRRAEAGKAYAEAQAAEFSQGTYAKSFEVDADIQHSSTGKSRAYGELSNKDKKAFVVEFGSGDEGLTSRRRPQGGWSPARRVLGKSLDVMENA